ncbi:pirin family protein [Oleisolibacter albus]|uniref:pirin family protein n=1 Tax=Oleisolibacter albus TaxID=2171757 RepID=UPI000DF250B1|nr:pirin family protein [Oleisolibacter albus]
MRSRSLRRLHPALRDDIGDLVTRRPLPGPRLPHLDPFLFLNHHGPQTYAPGNRGLPFGPHPHRGFETVTFILDGELAHLDSGGHESIITAGGVQWMTAGRGLVHAELSPAGFKRRGGPLEILQLWVNLPARLKLTEPRYVGLQAADLPVATAGGVRVVPVTGAWNGVAGPVRSLTGLTLMTVHLDPGARFQAPLPPGHAVFLYTVRGGIDIGGQAAPAFHLVELDGDGDGLDLTAGDDGAILLFGHGEPFAEPIVAHGPFVMNTRDEIVQAVQDYQAGLFGTVPGL